MLSPSPKIRRLLWLLSLTLILSGILLVYGFTQGLATPAQDGAPDTTGELTGTPSALDRLWGLPLVPTASPMPSPTPVVLRLALPEPLPEEIQGSLLAWLADQPGGQVVAPGQPAQLRLSLAPGARPLIEHFYVAVAPFATLRVEVSEAELLELWRNGPGEDQQPLAVDAETWQALRLLWGDPTGAERLPDVEAVVAALWENRQRLGIVPFHRLSVRLRALPVSGNDPTDNRFDPLSYPLALRLYLEGEEPAINSLRSHVATAGIDNNRNPQKLTVLAMTGVTAMARLTALRMEQQGYDYPARIVGQELAAADLTHISNEIPFVPGCQVNISQDNLTFCSAPEYLEALRLVGVDLVGLTGNHLNDFGREASIDSLQLYIEQALPFYGGGANQQEASRALLVQHNDNRLAFLGANSYGPQLAWAETDWPGAARYDLPTLLEGIAQARNEENAHIVLVELQWEESYDALPIPSQRDNFRLLSAAGADIVTGVQSHVPQAIEFGDGGLILYGLGNLFFDQMWSLETRQGLVARHSFYDGRHLNTALLVTVLEDYAQPRWATNAEREAVLGRVFTASGW